MKRGSEKKHSKIRRKVKYLLLLLLLSLNFSFAFGYIRKLNSEINELQGQLSHATATVTDQANQISLLQTKINLLAKGDLSQTVLSSYTVVHKVVESAPDVVNQVHLIDPGVVVTTVGTVVTFVVHSIIKIGELVH